MPYRTPYEWTIRMVVVRMIGIIPETSIAIRRPGIWTKVVHPPNGSVTAVIDTDVLAVVDVHIHVLPAVVDIDLIPHVRFISGVDVFIPGVGDIVAISGAG